jgi:inner membrane protein
MLTNGGLGVAVLGPFDWGRYCFPFRPLAVSPIGVGRFFSARGLEVLRSEALWVGLPSAAVALAGRALTRRRPPSAVPGAPPRHRA